MNFRIFCMLGALLLFSGLAAPRLQAYSYSAWGTMTGDRTFAVNPFIYGGIGPFSLSADLVASYGFTPHIDLFVDLGSFNLNPNPGYAGSWVMPRWEFAKNNILALRVGIDNTDPPGFWVEPGYHFFAENGRWAVELNLDAKIPVRDPGGTLFYAVVAPVFKILPGTLHLFLEADPSFNLGSDSASLTVVPGACLILGSHQFCAGLLINDATRAASLGYGLWYWTSFGVQPAAGP